MRESNLRRCTFAQLGVGETDRGGAHGSIEMSRWIHKRKKSRKKKESASPCRSVRRSYTKKNRSVLPSATRKDCCLVATDMGKRKKESERLRSKRRYPHTDVETWKGTRVDMEVVVYRHVEADEVLKAFPSEFSIDCEKNLQILPPRFRCNYTWRGWSSSFSVRGSNPETRFHSRGTRSKIERYE